ncbi:MAG TPA: hypothetical protein VLA48_06410 [Nitrososphaeraceae archaeon]|nr:hypothetical protein [Nitrososphaeraceae archaeon]
MNNFSFVSFIIIGLFVYATYNLYQSFSVEENDSSQLNNNKESDNDFFNSLSRTLPDIDEDPPDENEELDKEGVIFDNFNTEESNNEEGSSMKIESNEQEIRDSLTESLNNGFSNGNNQETEIINEKGSSEDIEQSSSNEDNDNEDNENIDNIETR